MDCVFCTGITAGGEVVFEDELCWIVLHDDWAVRGHAMVVAKRHVENASDLSAEEWAHLSLLERTAERALLDATAADRAILMKLGLQTPHLHIHIYPVMRSASREEVFAAIDGRTRADRDPALVADIRRRLNPAGAPR